MNRIYVLLICCMTVFITNSCSESLLDISNPNVLTTKDFWKTETDATLGVNACYNSFYKTGSWHRYLHWRYDLISDEGYGLSPMVEANDWTKFIYNNYNHNENNGWIWRECYRGIHYCNQVLENVPNITFSNETVKNRMLGQAYFIRAHHYFHLSVFFEEVPIITTVQNPGDQPKQNTLAEVWAQMESDLGQAMSLLPEEWTGADKGRVTVGAAKAQLAKIFLMQKDYAKAKEQLDWLVTGSGKQYYGLMPNYKDNFSSATENNIESVFEIQMGDNYIAAEGDGKNAYNGHQRSIIFGLLDIGFRDGVARPWVLEEFKKERTADGKLDPRLRVTFIYKDLLADFGDEELGTFYGRPWSTRWDPEVYFRKYSRDAYMTVENRWCEINFRVIRFADILLQYAECLNELGQTDQAYQYVDRVRERAGMQPLAVAYPEIGNDRQKFFERLQTERILELNGECTRWHDIKRWELYSTPAGLNALIERDPDYKNFVVGKSHRQPIPTSEVENNPNLKQISPY